MTPRSDRCAFVCGHTGGIVEWHQPHPVRELHLRNRQVE